MPRIHRVIQPAIAMLAVISLGACAPSEPGSETAAPAAMETQTSQAAPAPTQEQHETHSAVAAPRFSTYRTSDGLFEFEHPSDWSVIPNPTSSPNEGYVSLVVQDAQGIQMAAFASGFPAANDSVVVGPIPPVPLEYQKIPDDQIAPTYEGAAIAFHYETRFNPMRGEVGAEISINTFKSDFPISSSLPGFHIDTTTGAAFSRWISPSDDLPDVDPSLKAEGGSRFFEAYQRTTEYQAVKEMMTSLRRIA